MIITRSKAMERMLKDTGINLAKIAGLYVLQQNLSTKLRELTKDTSSLAAQQIRYMRNKYEK